jgi:glycyl-tRNA synthetase beta chain
MSEKTFLVEIGTEELPPKALRSLAESFAANFTAELDNAGIAHGNVEWFAAASSGAESRESGGISTRS